MDSYDFKILELLQENSKRTTKEIALRVNLSATAVYERIKKLERDNIISKYTIILDKSKIDRDFVVLCHVKLLQHTKEFVTEFEKDVIKLTEVLECYHVSGDYDYILKVMVKDMAAYREFMVTKLTSLKHIGSTHSTFVIGEVKYSHSFQF